MTPTIRVENVSKCYRIHHKVEDRMRDTTLREEFAKWFRWPGRRREPDEADDGAPEEFWALKDVSFEVSAGEVLGVVGRNGAGKSTLLKILSRITRPTRGRVRLRGRLGSLLEVGTGFHPELTGRENIFLNGAILGMRRHEIQRQFHDIVAFANIEEFLDTPVKRYSSGMYTRLAFAVAAHFDPEILVVDEVLAVGDAEFQKRCLGRMSEVASQGRTVVFVSHNAAAVSQLCNSGLLLENGRVSLRGTANEVVDAYFKATSARSGTATPTVVLQPRDRDASFTRAELHGTNGAPRRKFRTDEPVCVVLSFSLKRAIPGLHVSVAVRNARGEKLFYTSNRYATPPAVVEEPGDYALCATIPAQILLPGTYSLNLGLALPNRQLFDFQADAITFEITTEGWERNDYRPEDLGGLLIPVSWEPAPTDLAPAGALPQTEGQLL